MSEGVVSFLVGSAIGASFWAGWWSYSLAEWLRHRQRQRHPLPRVRWWRVWRHRSTLLCMLTRVAHGTIGSAIIMARDYGGSDDFGRDLHRAAVDILEERT